MRRRCVAAPVAQAAHVRQRTDQAVTSAHNPYLNKAATLHSPQGAINGRDLADDRAGHEYTATDCR